MSIILIVSGLLVPQVSAQSSVITPEKYFGFVPGSDYMLFNYEELIGYFQEIDKASPMLKMIETGQSPMGKKMYIAFISSEKNIKILTGCVKLIRCWRLTRACRIKSNLIT